MPSRSRAALAAVCAAAAVLQCAAFQRLPLAPARRAALACGRGRCPARMARAPPQAAAGDDSEGEDEQAPRPKINWSDRFKRALDMNPGRTERLSRTEQELRYQQVLAANPKDVDALCGYACFLSTVKVRVVARGAPPPPGGSPPPALCRGRRLHGARPRLHRARPYLSACAGHAPRSSRVPHALLRAPPSTHTPTAGRLCGRLGTVQHCSQD